MVNTEFRMRASRGGSASTTTFGVMSASFAAEQLWQQVENQKTLRIFDWKTRLGLFFSRYLLPKALVAKFLASTINKRI
jgi:short-subunit dehydrogenase